MPLDPAIVDLIKQLPVSAALIIVLIYFIRTNRQDRHELNDVAIKQAETSELSAHNQQKLIERTDTIEANMATVSAQLVSFRQLIEGMASLERTIAQRVEQAAEKSAEAAQIGSTIRTKDDAVAMNAQLRDDIKADTALTVSALSTDLAKTHQVVADLPIRLDALIAKVDGVPENVRAMFRQEYLAVVAERDEARKSAAAEREQKEQAQASLATFQQQNAKLTADLMARDTTIAEQAAENRDLREMLAQMKLEKAAMTEAIGLPPIVPKSPEPPAVPL